MCQNVHPSMCQVFYLSSPLVTPYSVSLPRLLACVCVYGHANNNNNNSLLKRLTYSSPSLLLLSLFPFSYICMHHALCMHPRSLVCNFSQFPRTSPTSQTRSVCLPWEKPRHQQKTSSVWICPSRLIAASCSFSSLFFFLLFLLPISSPCHLIFSLFSVLSKLPLLTSLSRCHHICTKKWRRHLSSLPPSLPFSVCCPTRRRRAPHHAPPHRGCRFWVCCSSFFPSFLLLFLRIRISSPLSHVSSLYIYSVWTLLSRSLYLIDGCV